MPLTKYLKLVTMLMMCSSFLLLQSCVIPDQQLTESEDDGNGLNGIWDVYALDQSVEFSGFINVKNTVGLVDTGETVILDQCIHDQNIVLNKEGDFLVNNSGEKLEIVSNQYIQSFSVPEVVNLEKKSTNNFRNAGTVTLQSNAIPSIHQTTGVCARRIIRDSDNFISIEMSMPFESSYLDIELLIEDVNARPFNISRMTLKSPALIKYYNSAQVDAMTGLVEFTTLSDDKLEFTFDISTIQSRNIVGGQFIGAVDVNL